MVPLASSKRALMKCLLLNAAQPRLAMLGPAAGRPSCPSRNQSSCQVSLGKAEDEGDSTLAQKEGWVLQHAACCLPLSLLAPWPQ